MALGRRVTDPSYLQRAVDITIAMESAADQPSLHALFLQGIEALGAQHGLFVNFVQHDDTYATCRFMVGCDPHWARSYIDERHFEHDAWLTYAARNVEPVLASDLPPLDQQQRRVRDLAGQAGFASAVIVPAHAAAGCSRASVLCLGSATPGYFEDAGLRPFMRCARLMTMELHDWWLRQLRRDLQARSRLTADDLLLLHHQCLGHSSKRIAAELDVSLCSVNSRFQRLHAKLGVANRRMAAQVAIDCGLILK